MQRLDLGVLATRRHAPLTVAAPSRFTRAIWLAGAGACFVFIWSIALTLGWLEQTSFGLRFARLPRLSEAVYWLLPLLIAGLSLSLSFGGVRLLFHEDGLQVTSYWPARRERLYPWSQFRYARFWEEKSRSRERLFAMRFVFAEVDLTFRLADEKVWLRLRDRFMA